MSSDSDSDICDFTSNISKQMSKGLNQFWQDFNKKTDKEQEAADASYNADKENANLIEAVQEVMPVCNTLDGESSVSIQCSNNPRNEVTTSTTLDINIKNRITNKLNELSAEIETILQDKRNKPKRGTKRKTRKQPIRRGRSARITVNQPVPNVSNSISISSGDENEETFKIHSTVEEELNPVVTVNVLWKSVEKNSFKVHKYQMLSCILEHYSEKSQVNSKLLFFMVDNKHIKLEENSFVSLRLDATKQIEGGVLPEEYLNNPDSIIALPDIEPLKFKVQCNDRKKATIDVSCRENDKMEIIFWKVSRHFEQSVDNIKIYFDGHLIKPSDKICEMDLEDGDCFDLEILNVPVNTK